ncbi:MAG: ribonuclease R [Clostridia bacterium]|nr:ribonuclease R [Clostridia bacterium]
MNHIDNLEKMMELVRETVDGELYTPMDMRDMTAVLALEPYEYDLFAEAVGELIRLGEICETKRGKLIKTADSGYIVGTYKATTRGFGFLLQDDGDIFISRDNAHGAMMGDRVIVSLIKENGHGEHREGEVIRITQRAVTEVVGTLHIVRMGAAKAKVGKSKKKGKKAPVKAPQTRVIVTPDDPKFTFKLVIPTAQANGAKDGDKVLVRITRYPGANDDNAMGKVLRTFGATDSRTANYQAILHANGIKTRFDDATLAEARAIVPGCKLDGRLDLRDKIIFTIDGADAKDFDDAISIERDGDGYLLGVHIADVAEYVSAGSALDDEAMHRGTSIYFTDKVVPMLPEELSNGVCSLNRDSDKYALSALIRIDRDGGIVEAEFRESVISSKVRGVYHEVNDVLENGDKSEFFEKYEFLLSDTLPLMLELYEILLEKSRRRGSLELETTESVILLDEDGEPWDIVARERGVSERMIEQFMLAANEAAASWLTSMALPCVFRIHEEPSDEKVQTFAEFIHNLGLDVRPLRRRKLLPSSYRDVAAEAAEKGLSAVVTPIMLRSLMKAKYSPVAAPHFGLGCELYCHFTSPIRRYPDLAVHRIIKAALHGGIDDTTLGKFEAFAAKAAEESSENELRALNAERDIEDLYKVIFMSDKVGMEFEGIVSSVTGFGMFVELENTCEGLVRIDTLRGWYEFDEKSRRLIGDGGKSFSLGQRVRIVVDDCDIVSRRVDFLLVE